ncbi:MAG: methylated-DNA--[protein]-cysteine S-methyltransferase [Solirubrobacteraceae bacterium]
MNTKIEIFKTKLEKKKPIKLIKTINFSVIETFFGKMFIASSEKGICSLVFQNDIPKNINFLKNKFPKVELIPKQDQFQINTQKLLNKQYQNNSIIYLHLVGTEFQLKVWESLLKISFGTTTFYGEIANSINNSKALRAVGTAIGNNPIAFIIPCHRVLQKTGKIGGYKWGIEKKIEILAWEKHIKK